MFLEKMIVWYNPLHIIGIRIFTIPIEDTVYAYQLILANLLLWKYLETKTSFQSRLIRVLLKILFTIFISVEFLR